MRARDDFQQALQSALATASTKKEPLLSKLRARFSQASKVGKQQALAPMPATVPEGSHIPGLHYTPLERLESSKPKSAARNETKMQSKRVDYRPALYGVRDQAADTLEYVFQPWYQELLEMGNLRVCLLVSVCSCISRLHPCNALSAAFAACDLTAECDPAMAWIAESRKAGLVT